jgi:hypothetical protein
MPFAHRAEPQSPFLPHALPSEHVGEQAGGWQTPPVQTREAQSPSPTHATPSTQSGEQGGGWHVPAQMLDRHWLLFVQTTPVLQLGAQETQSPALHT